MNEQKDRTRDRLVWLGDVKDGILKWWEENEHPLQDPWCTVLNVVDAITAITPTADAVPMDYHDRCMEEAEADKIRLAEKLQKQGSTTERLPEEGESDLDMYLLAIWAYIMSKGNARI